MPTKDPVLKREQYRRYYARNSQKIQAKRKARPQSAGQRAAAVARSRRWREQNIRKDLVHHVRGRAKRRGIEFAISAEDLHWPDVCPVLGLVLDYSVGSKNQKPQPGSPSLDRVNPELGYVLGNVRVISYRANAIKNNASADELEAVARYARMHE